MTVAVTDVPGGAQLTVKVVPGASRDRVVGPMGDALKVQVTAPPEGGRANERLCEVLAEALGVPVRAVEVRSGQTHTRKVVAVRGLDAAAVRSRIAGASR